MDTAYFYFFVIFGVYIFMMLIPLALGVMRLIATWKLYKKAGEHGWAAIVPVYDFFVKCRIAFGSFKKAWIYLGISAALTAVLTVESFVVPMIPSDSTAFRLLELLLMLIAVACYIGLLVILGCLNYNFSKAYGKPLEWNVCMIFFAPILTIVLGFDKKTVFIGNNGNQ